MLYVQRKLPPSAVIVGAVGSSPARAGAPATASPARAASADRILLKRFIFCTLLLGGSTRPGRARGGAQEVRPSALVGRDGRASYRGRRPAVNRNRRPPGGNAD